MRGYPQFSFWISITHVTIYIPRIIINRGKNTFESVGTVLNKLTQIKSNFGFWGEGKTGVPGEKPLSVD